MKFNLLALACALALAFGLSMGSFAGSVADADLDGIPDQYDNCVNNANGPLLGTCSTNNDGDEDGYGNSCDRDFNNNGATDVTDLTTILNNVGSADPQLDLNCNGLADLSDLTVVLNSLGSTPGPSGLGCAVANTKLTCPPL
jgi:hypothetical protein